MSTAESRARFSKESFDNVQALIRVLDAKASFILVTVGIVMTQFMFLLKNMFDVNTSDFFRRALCCLATAFFVLVFRALYFSMACLYPRNHPKSVGPIEKRHLFPLMILESFKSGDDYVGALNKLNAAAITKEYGLQVFINSNIYLAKLKNLNIALGSLQLCLAVWILANGTLIVEYLKPFIAPFMAFCLKGA